MASDIYATYGFHVGDPTDYGYICGLILNLDRSQSRLAYATAVGMKAAMGGAVSSWFFEGIAPSSEEARAMARRHNLARERRMAAKMAKLGPVGFLMGARNG